MMKWPKRVLKKDVAIINGAEMKTFYKVKVTHSLKQSIDFKKRLFKSVADKIDACIINFRNYNNLSPDLEKILFAVYVIG